jgi:hypothetical protein
MVNRITIKRLSEIMRTIPLLCTGLPGYCYPDESRLASLSAFPGQGAETMPANDQSAAGSGMLVIPSGSTP